MHKLNKITALLLAVIMLLTLNACGMAEQKAKEDNTIRITLGRYDSSNLEKELIKQFPDINFEFEYYKGFATTEYYRSQILNDETGDVFISTLKFEDEICKQHLMDLSGYSFVGNFENSILNQYDIDGAIYFLPGPIMVRSMAYNKTLFEEYGWQAPTNHDELVQLVKQIRAESDLTPISFGAKGLGYYFTTMTTLSQTAYLAKAQGTTWEKAYLAGEVSCREGFEPGIEMVEELIEADAYDIEIDVANNDEWAMQRFVEREAAMITIWGWQSKFIEKLEKSEDELLLLPFYNRDGESFLGTNVSFHTGLPKRLEEKGNEKKLANALRIIEWLSTPEGMSTMNMGSAEILPLTVADNFNTAEVYREVWEANISGMKAPMLYAGYEDIIIQASEFIKDAMLNGKSLDGLVELIDELHQQALNTPEQAAIGSIGESFTQNQTVQLMADIIQSTGAGDITLVSRGGYKNGVANYPGVHGKLYKGSLFLTDLVICIPGDGAHGSVFTAELTGKQIKELVENGKETYSDDRKSTEMFDYYWSGLDVKTADGGVTEIKLANGTELTETGVYTVAFAENDWPKAIEKLAMPVDTEINIQELYRQYLEANSPLLPPELSR